MNWEKTFIIISIINAYMAGYFLQTKKNVQYKSAIRKFFGKLISQLWFLFFGIEGLVIYLLFRGIRPCLNWFGKTLQLQFWWKWHTGAFKVRPSDNFMEIMRTNVVYVKGLKKRAWHESHFLVCAKKLFNKFDYEWPN